MFKTSICLLSLVTIVNVAASQNCTAKVTVTQTARDQDTYGATFKYRIEATSDASSAVVHFKIRRTYDVNGSHYSQSEPWSVVVQGGQAEDSGELRDSTSPRQIQWSVEDILCKKTDTGNGGSNSLLVAGEPDGIDADAYDPKDPFRFTCTKGSQQSVPAGPFVAEGPEFVVSANGVEAKSIGVFWGRNFRIRYFPGNPDVVLLIVVLPGLRVTASGQGSVQISLTGDDHIQHSVMCDKHL